MWVGLDKYTNIKLPKYSTDSLKKVSMQGLSSVMRLSPVDNGTFRANWNVELDGVNTSINSNLKSGRKTGSIDSGAKLRGESIINGIRVKFVGGTKEINISNAMPYAKRLEYGWSDKASEGMVRVTAEKIRQRYRI